MKIAAGPCLERIDFKGKPIRVDGERDDGIVTVIDASGLPETAFGGAVGFLNRESPASLPKDFTITGGVAEKGDGAGGRRQQRA